MTRSMRSKIRRTVCSSCDYYVNCTEVHLREVEYACNDLARHIEEYLELLQEESDKDKGFMSRKPNHCWGGYEKRKPIWAKTNGIKRVTNIINRGRSRRQRVTKIKKG